MTIEAVVDSLDAIPEELRDDYVEVDGQYKLKVLQGYVPQDQVEDVTGLKSALHKERDNGRELARKLRQVQEQYGNIDMDEYNALREAQAKAEEDRRKKAGEWDALKQQLVDGFAKKEDTWNKREAELIASIETQLIDADSVAAINEHKGNALLLKPHVRGATKVFREDDGRFVTRIVDDAGNPRLGADGKYLTVSDYVRELRENETFAGAFLGSGSSGGGTPPGAGQQGQGSRGKGGIPSDLKRSGMTPLQKVEFIEEHGHDEFMKLPA